MFYENEEGNDLRLEYLSFLEPWIKTSQRYITTCPGREELLCYGTGYNTWGVQTHQKAFSAYAILGMDPRFDEKKAGIKREKVIDTALRMLRFSLESHIEGNYYCLDKTKWGHTWISVLGIERMMHAVEAIEEYLTEADKANIKKVLISESNWLMDNYEVVAGTVSNNKPESNLWNGAMLHRTVAMYPDTLRAEEYKEKGTKFLINSISIASDAISEKVIDGKKISQWYVGDNFFESYALNHHGYLNVGYMVICLSNIAMLHFMFKKKNISAPPALYHHAEELWMLVKECTFRDGRLLRIGGDTRVRYCYCQDYAIPMWLWAKDYLKDKDCDKFEKEWLKIVDMEIKNNKDGLYLSDRCKELEAVSPIYYTRLESDRAVALSMGAYWRRIFKELNESVSEAPFLSEIEESFSWHDDYHGACLQKGKNRIAAFVWNSAEGVQGLCLPPERSDMAEWSGNMTGQIKGIGNINYEEILKHYEAQYEGGFISIGKVSINSERFIAEGQGKEVVAYKKVLFAVLPDDMTTVVIQYANTGMRSYLSSKKGIGVKIPNDIFNKNKRKFYYNGGDRELIGTGSIKELWKTNSRWINIDDSLGIISIYGEEELSVFRAGKRTIGLKKYPWNDTSKDIGMLYVDEICTNYCEELQMFEEKETIFDLAYLVQAGSDHNQTKAYIESKACYSLKTEDKSMIRALIVTGGDCEKYLIITNVGDTPESVSLNLAEANKVVDLVSREEFIINRTYFKLDEIAENSCRIFLVQ